MQLCGDAHVLNFGLWATPERNLSFDLRDFDETLPGPFEWDVKRLAASLVVAARAEPDQAGDGRRRGRPPAVDAYRRRMRRYATMPELDIWYDGMHVDGLIGYFEPADRGPSVGPHREEAEAPHQPRRVREADDDGPRPPADHAKSRRSGSRSTTSEQADLVDQLLADYRLTLQEDRRHLFDRFTEADVVRQVVGVGSVGMRVYLVLLEGRSGADPLFLQVKQAGPSVYEAHTQPSRHGSHGERVISGKRLVQSATDIFVGWGSLRGRDYYVRQFRDMKIIPTTDLIAPRLVEFATACGETLARAHARTGDPVAINGYMGTGPNFTAAIASSLPGTPIRTTATMLSSSARSQLAPRRARQAEEAGSPGAGSPSAGSPSAGSPSAQATGSGALRAGIEHRAVEVDVKLDRRKTIRRPVDCPAERGE